MEDDSVVLRLCQTVLERQGYSVLAAIDAAEAHQIAAPASSIDLALVDVMLPGQSGAELIRQLRRDGMTAPVVCMSGYPVGELPGIADPETLCGWFLPKPFTPRQLLDMVAAALRQAR